MDKALKELEEIRRNYCSCELHRRCVTCDMMEAITQAGYEKFDEVIELKKDKRDLMANMEGMVKLSDVRLNEAKVLEVMNKILDNPNEVFMNWREVVSSALASKSSELLTVEEK